VWTCGFNNWGQLGVLFGAEEDSALPRPLLSLQSVQPCRVSCGTNHSLMVTEGGDLCVSFTFCCCCFKQLKLEAVCAGPHHCRWTWGRGDCGQLGHGDRRSRHEPQLVKGLREVWVISAGGGDFHSIACADNGGESLQVQVHARSCCGASPS
jgi:alpha-tubulin suppressor-like RCC1 family protein